MTLNPYATSDDDKNPLIADAANISPKAIFEGRFISEFSRNEIVNFLQDARFAILVGLIPILYILILWWLIQWNAFKSRYPFLASGDAGDYISLAQTFRSVFVRILIAVIGWPIFTLHSALVESTYEVRNAWAI
jgi:hypothetical protein